MISAQTKELLRCLYKGKPDQSNQEFLEQVNVNDWVEELKSFFRITFQERRIGSKWEISLARSIRTELAVRPIPESILVSLAAIPVYVNCIMITVEDNAITGVSRLNRLAVRATAKPIPGVVMKTGRGFKLDKLPDGWEVKPLRSRTVQLNESFLQARGWRFESLSRYLPTV